MVGFEARTQQGAALRPTSHFVYESIYTAILEKRLAPAAKLSKEPPGRSSGSATVPSSVPSPVSPRTARW